MTVAVGSLAAASLSACSSSGTAGTGGTGAKSPALALSAGVQKLSDGKSASFELSLKPDDALITAMNKKSSASDAAIAKKVFSNGGVDLKITTSADKPLKDIKAGDTANAEIDFKAGGVDYVDIRYVGGALYAKAGVKDALALAGMPMSTVTDELSAGKLPPELSGPAQALVNGNWVGVSAADMKSLTQLAGSLGGGDLAASPSAPNQMQLTQIGSNLITALTKDATITDKGNGKLEVSGKVKTIAQDVVQAYEPLVGSLPGQSKTGFTKLKDSLAGIPDSQNVTFDVWLANGALTELQIDLAQFLPAADSGGGHFPLDMKISQTASAVTAPSGPTMVDVKKVISSFTSGL
jgi:hypothetical protein